MADTTSFTVEPEPSEGDTKLDFDIMACAWLFFAVTTLQLVSTVAQWEGGVALNVIANTVYTQGYMSFLAMYARVPKAPGLCTSVGIFLYFLGYIMFLAHSGCSVVGADRSVDIGIWLNRMGVGLFIGGSGLLMRAHLPPRELKRRFSPLRAEAACWWGAVCFLLGSMILAIDASGFAWALDRAGSAYTRALATLVVFTLGRVFFIWGSQTPRCDIFLRSTARDPVLPGRKRGSFLFPESAPNSAPNKTSSSTRASAWDELIEGCIDMSSAVFTRPATAPSGSPRDVSESPANIDTKAIAARGSVIELANVKPCTGQQGSKASLLGP